MTIRNLIFDLDGTLIDSSEGVVESVNYALRKAGEQERPPEVIKRYIGYPLRQMFADFTTVSGDTLYRLFQERAADLIVASARPLRDVQEVLRELRERGYSMSIATTKTRSHLDGIVAKLGWAKLFPDNVSGSDVSEPKPDPEAIHLALKKMKSLPGQALVIGDTVNDVRAAKAVPVRVAAVASPYGGDDEVAALGPDYTLGDFSDLLEILPPLAMGGRP